MTTSSAFYLATGVWHPCDIEPESCWFPVREIIGSTALVFGLEVIPCLGDNRFVISILVHCFIHVLLDQCLHIGPKNSHSDASSNLAQDYGHHQEGERTQHADILHLGAAASKEGHHEDDAPEDDQSDCWSVKLFIKELDVRAEEDLGHCSHSNEGHARQEEDRIEDEDQIFDRKRPTS